MKKCKNHYWTESEIFSNLMQCMNCGFKLEKEEYQELINEQDDDNEDDYSEESDADSSLFH